MISINIQVETKDELDAVKAFFSASVSPAALQATAILQPVVAPVSDQPAVAEQTAEPEQPKEGAVQRRRRTKQEMEVARAAEAETKSPEASTETAPPEETPAEEADTGGASEVEEQAEEAASTTALDDVHQEPDDAQVWDMATLKARIGGLQTYVATQRTIEILAQFGMKVEQIAPAPGATITPILQHLGTKNLTGLIELGQDKVRELIAIYDAIMKG